jgi:DNA-binding LacI/PurR family transcriptional regulator
MKVTQQDIARLAQVSQSTVSRVIAGDERVASEVRERVQSVMRQANYHVDARAKSFRSRSTELIGLVLHRPEEETREDPFLSMLVQGITESLAGSCYRLTIEQARTRGEQSRIYDDMLRSRRVDGVLYLEPEVGDARLARLQKDNFPIVVLGNPGPLPITSVDNDNVLAGRLATRHLIDQGHTSIGYLGGPEGILVSDERGEGYANTMREAGMPTRCWHARFGFHSARQRAYEIFRSPNPPEALVVLDDTMAVGVMQAAEGSGLYVPRDLAVVSFNDSILCSMVPPGLSSVNLGMNDMISLAVRRLLGQLQHPEAGAAHSRTIVPCELKIRGSSSLLVEASL